MKVLDDKIKSHPKKDGETHFSDKQKIDQDDGTKDNPIPTECLEVIAFPLWITDQELMATIETRKAVSMPDKRTANSSPVKLKPNLMILQKTDSEHDRNAHEEGEFCRDEA